MAQSFPSPPRADRLDAIDLLRGLVMVIMALDHVRDFFSNRLFMDPVDLDTTTSGIFLTRWITHYCAPTFIFLAGTGAYLSMTRGKSKGELSIFLLTRGLWLALFEITINRAFWMFDYKLFEYGAGVFWAIGWSMVILAGLVRLPTGIVRILGLTIIGLHNLLDGMTAADVGLPKLLWVILHQPGDASVFGRVTFGTAYCVLPWAGTMMAGYGFGTLFRLERPVRRKMLLLIGTLVTLGFVALRFSNAYGDARLWSDQGSTMWTTFSFLNCTKYPPSLLYLMMTLGPAIFLIGLFDRPLGKVAQPILVFGRVPFFFYLLHIPLIHGSAVALDYVRFGWSPLAMSGPWNMKLDTLPTNYGVDLPTVYLIWVGVVFLLYFPCRWFAGVKRRHRSAWLSYV